MLIKKLYRRCPVCDSGRGEVLHTQAFAAVAEIGNSDSVDIVSCTQCGVAFSDIPTQQEELDTVYRDHSKYADTSMYKGDGPAGILPPDAPWDLERLEGTADYLSGVIGDHAMRVLDAGCATGSLLGFLSARGFTSLLGLDPSPIASAAARRLHAVDAIAGSFITPPPDIGKFGLVVLSHVLEHLGDVKAAVRSMSDLVEPGGLVYLEVPNAVRYVDHLVAPFHDFNTEHINHFSAATLRRLMTSHGFSEVDSGEKVVMCSPKFTYPALYGLWRHGGSASVMQASAEPDMLLIESLRCYVEQSHELMRRINDGLREQIDVAHPVVLWGAGQLSLKLLSDSVLSELPIDAIVDSSPQKQGLHIGDRVVVAPSAMNNPAACIVIASVHHEDAIERTIRVDMGLPNRIVKLAGLLRPVRTRQTPGLS
jgi:SAM-dependent methyltransferase